MKKIVLFASGSGSNAENIINYFQDKAVQILWIVTNKRDAFVVERARKHSIPVLYVNRSTFYESDCLAETLLLNEVDLIVLAGFLWLIPPSLVSHFPNKIINIHPALLPKYGGKGMYGMHVHHAVCENKDAQTGITIHYVNEAYDEGQVIFQTTCAISSDDTPDSIADKVHALEYEWFPKVVEDVLLHHDA